MSNDRYDLTGRGSALADRSRTRLLYVSTAKYGGDWHSIPHTHTCTELFYVVDGKGQFRIRDRLLPVAADDLVIINPNIEHTEVSLDASPLEYLVLGVEGLELDLEDEGSGYSIVGFQNHRENLLPTLRSMLREIEEKRTGYESICQNLLEVVLVRLVRQTDFTLAVVPSHSRGSTECASVRRYIEAHFKEDITLAHLAAFAHVSKYYLVHAFTKEFGVSPISYLISLRIQESKYLLTNTNHSLSQIAHLLGFSSPSYFSQSFRRAEGISPLEYRRNRKAENLK